MVMHLQQGLAPSTDQDERVLRRIVVAVWPFRSSSLFVRPIPSNFFLLEGARRYDKLVIIFYNS